MRGSVLQFGKGVNSSIRLTEGRRLSVSYTVALADALNTSPVLSMLCMMTA
ncbi:hypothetical protein SAMN05216328_1853, partial [Ensifer sp. YR511]